MEQRRKSTSSWENKLWLMGGGESTQKAAAYLKHSQVAGSPNPSLGYISITGDKTQAPNLTASCHGR